ncbi:MAG: ABC transporter permease [Clostridia bacterium]|nr:ABC transporter permease [Clostridia bacterium]
MRKTHNKNFLRTIKDTFGRFAAIFAIVALGVGFLVGLLSSTPDMRYSFDEYLDSSAMYDIRVLGDMGLTDEDITAIRSLEGVQNVQAGYLADVTMNTAKDTEYTARLHSLSLDSGENTINIPQLSSGRLPEKAGECVVVNIPSVKSDIQIGDKLTVNEDNKNLSDILNTTEYTVVGFADYCQYFSAEKEYTNIGSGTLSLFLLVPDTSFATDFYTDVYISAAGASALTSLTNEYQELVDETAARVKAIAGERSLVRHDELVALAEKKLTEAAAEYAAANGITDVSQTGLEAQVPEIAVPEWHVYTRADNTSYSSIEANIDKVNAIAKVFPFFFFLVAALVCLTTMTRMVEDERLQIGTMKALGYSRSAIMGKYLLYAFSASALGSAIGVAFGYRLFPTVIWNAYTMTYALPNFYCPLNWAFASATSAAAILLTLLVTFFACRSTLKEEPAALMLFKAPQPGKRVFLERITPIWSRLKFTHKVTARNIFRYKKRFLMTTIGIAGCTALILTGFGLRDSFSDIADRQFGTLNTYDIMAPITDEANFENDELLAILKDTEKVEGSTKIDYQSIEASNGDKSLEITTFIPENASDLDGYVNFRNRASGKTLSFESGSVIITEKASELLDVKVGDKLELTGSDGNSGFFKISGISENYVGNFIYMDSATYAKSMGQEAVGNMLIIRLTESGLSSEADIGKSILETGAAGGVSYITDAKDAVSRALGKMGTIVAAVILSAGALALVVLYNLTNINISERVKEIATIKVLGFTDREVNAYINREAILLSAIGTVFGLVLGVFLHRYVMGCAEMDNMMFGRTVRAISFLYSAGLTMAFSLLIDLIMEGKLRKISMVESMKAPE